MLKTLLWDSLRFFGNNYISLVIITLPMFAFIEAFDVWYAGYTGFDQTKLTAQIVIPILVGMVIYPIYTASIIIYMDAVINEKSISVLASWNAAIVRWLPMFSLYIIYGVVVLLGMLAFILPGLVFMVRFCFAEFNLLLNEQAPIPAMNASRQQTKDVFWLLLAGFVVITVVIHGLYFGALLFSRTLGMANPLFDSLLNILLAVLYLFYSVFSYRVYHFVQKSTGSISTPA